MKISVIALALAGVMLAAQPVLAAGMCLRVKDIKSSDAAKDGRSILFKMSDGKVYRNDLQGRCPDLWFNGFSWTIHADEVCDGDGSLTVLRSGEVCGLGKFTSVAPSPAKAPG